MLTAIILPLVFIGVFGLAAFFWFWWAAPQTQVPPYLEPDDLKRLEVQDRLRQTNYQVLTGIGLVATFFATLVQLTITARQWSSDYELRVKHEQVQQFADASKDLANAINVPLADQAALRLHFIAMQNPSEFYDQATTMFSSVVREQTKNTTLRNSDVCMVDSDPPPAEKTGAQHVVAPTAAPEGTPAGRPMQKKLEGKREEPPAAAQASLKQLGSPQFAALRRRPGASCVGDSKSHILRLRLENRSLDNFDLSGLDLSCSKMSQVELRRANLNSAKLFGVDLRGARLADWEIQNSPASTGFLDGTKFTTARIGFDSLDESQQTSRLPAWQTYYCFITDLRYADLRAVDLENASLSGADLAFADLTGANLCGVDISRANFTGAKGVTARMIAQTCAGRPADNAEEEDRPDWDAQPIGLNKVLPKDANWVNRCPSWERRIKCEPMDPAAAYALVNRPRW
jgi:uncharacterized protein YjbI with pentapeptide repeats